MNFHLTIKLIFLLLLFKSAGAQLSSEFSVNGKRSELSFDMLHEIDKQMRWSVYSHDFVAYHHNDNKTRFLTFNKLSYTFKSGFGFSANLIGTLYRFYPSVGVHYDKKINHFRILLLTTYALDNNRSNETFLIFSYKYPVTKKVKFISQNEFYTSLRKWSPDHSIEKLKFGLEFHKTQTGVFNESVQDGIKFNLKTSKFGWYLKQSF